MTRDWNKRDSPVRSADDYKAYQKWYYENVTRKKNKAKKRYRKLDSPYDRVLEPQKYMKWYGEMQKEEDEKRNRMRRRKSKRHDNVTHLIDPKEKEFYELMYSMSKKDWNIFLQKEADKEVQK